MRIYTRGGDAGQTDLIGGPRVGKDHPRVQTFGCLDELNACLGLALACCEDDETSAPLITAQHHLFDLGAVLARQDPKNPPRSTPARPSGFVGAAEAMEPLIDRLDGQLEPLSRFILPGGCELASRLHLARTVCRRAERCVVELANGSPIDPGAVIYLNRLSDLLFVLARRANYLIGRDDVYWEQGGV